MPPTIPAPVITIPTAIVPEDTAVTLMVVVPFNVAVNVAVLPVWYAGIPALTVAYALVSVELAQPKYGIFNVWIAIDNPEPAVNVVLPSAVPL